MILILSISTDSTTKKVCDFLRQMKRDFFLLDENSIIDKVSVFFEGKEKKHNVKLSINNIELKLSDVKFVWYRRGDLNLFNMNLLLGINNKDLQAYYITEINGLKKFLYQYLDSIPHLNRYSDNQISKLEVLLVAQKEGLSIPTTLVTNNREDVDFHLNPDSKLITKAINMAASINFEGEILNGYTGRITKESLPQFFFPTKFQNEIPKIFEIRTFLLDNNFYSMAIFSQSNNNTIFDYRNRIGLENRELPIRLPRVVERRLLKIARKFQVKSASFDLIYSINHKYIFLEMNVIGQIENVSINCNYQLEKKIAEYINLKSK
jgi:hypothetical protein